MTGGGEFEHGGACPGSLKVAADVIGFVVITSATLYIAYKNITYKGPSGTERNFNGYREENMLALFVNLFASVAYYARVISNANCTRGFLMLTHIRYADYLTTCPLLVMDLLWNLEAPYKFTGAALIFITIMTGVACSTLPPPQSYYWFAFGDLVFVVVYLMLVFIVRERLNFFVAHAKSQKALKAMYYLKFACACFFMIWIWYPLIWIVSPYCLGIISIELNDFFHVILDVGAKSVYGMVLLWFRWNYDKKLLRNIEEEEYLEFSAKCTDRVAKMQIRIEDSDSQDGEGQDAHGAAREKQSSPTHNKPPASTLIQPFVPVAAADKSGKPVPEHEGKGTYGTGSRLLFASNRRQSECASPTRRMSVAASAVPRFGSEADRWLVELGQSLEERGVASHAAALTVIRLDQSGLTEEQLRTCVTDEDLEELGVDPAARAVILGRYGGGGGGGRGGGGGSPTFGGQYAEVYFPSMNDASAEEMRAFTPRAL